jgi:hypothetical protein
VQTTRLEAKVRCTEGSQRAGASSLIATLWAENKTAPNCVFPVVYNGAWVFGAMSGPNKPDPNLFEGIMGVCRVHPGEYELCNPGSGLIVDGSVSVLFEGVLPAKGTYYLLFDESEIKIRGDSRLMAPPGQGGYCTVGVRFAMGVSVAGNFVDYADELIHYDVSYNQDKTNSFDAPRIIQPRYVIFHGNAGDVVSLAFALDVYTSATELGFAYCYIDWFGFVANNKEDYSPAVLRAS